MPADPLVVVDGIQVALAAVRRDGDDDRVPRQPVAPGQHAGHDGSGRSAAERSIGSRQIAADPHGVGLGDRVQAVNACGVEERRPLARPQAGEVALARGLAERHRTDAVHGHDPRVRAVLAEMPEAAHERSRRPGPDEQIVHALERLGDRARRHPRVDARVVGVFILVEPDVPPVSRDQVADVGDPGSKIAAVAVVPVHDDDVRSQGPHDLDAVGRGVRVDDAGEAPALLRTDHAERDPEIPRGRFDEDRVVGNEAARRHVVDQPDGRLQLDRARRVQPFKLQVEVLQAETAQPEKRPVVDDVGNSLVHGPSFGILAGAISRPAFPAGRGSTSRCAPNAGPSARTTGRR